MRVKASSYRIREGGSNGWYASRKNWGEEVERYESTKLPLVIQFLLRRSFELKITLEGGEYYGSLSATVRQQ
jgi:hypothetical protein